ncbi:MAG: MerR family transcriptional regulator [Chloroflexi bacterium]|nr:MerR family transcriptional regulator [Chloroflexota bacterium]
MPRMTTDSTNVADPHVARFQIGEIAERTGVTQRTLRFYEEKGLLNPPERMDGGFRLYSDDDVSRIEYIKSLQDLLGFSLAEIKEMVEAEELLKMLRETYRPDRELPARLERTEKVIVALEKQLEVVEHKVEHLTAMREELRAKLERVRNRRVEIIGSLEQEAAAKAKAAEKRAAKK